MHPEAKIGRKFQWDDIEGVVTGYTNNAFIFRMTGQIPSRFKYINGKCYIGFRFFDTIPKKKFHWQ